MQERLEKRHEELRAEFEKGERTLEDLEKQAADVRQTLLRISGAIQVLEEMLGSPDRPHENGSGPHAEEPADETKQRLGNTG
jgi:uncharacterized coiled-coil protein SlyX